MRVAPPIELSPESRLQLERLSRRRTTPVRVAQRSRIILLAAEGLENKQIAERMSVAPRMVALWRGRFIDLGVEGLMKDAPRRGRQSRISAAMTARVLAKTTQSKPAGATHWSRSMMAREMGISESSVGRIWRAHGLKPHRIESFKISNDPHFAEKLEAIVGLYLNPPEHALVLSVDEKSQIQALDRTQPGLPLKKGRCGTMTHDYKRHGTTTSLAALNTLDGTVIGTCMPKHRHQEWIKFLRLIDGEIPKDKSIHLIADNYATHKHPEVQAWMAQHPRFTIHFTPTSASWLNMVERFFRDLTQKQLRRGIFRSVGELIASINDYLGQHNADPNPFIWTKSASDILEKVTRARQALVKDMPL